MHLQVNISLIVHDSEAKQCVKALHSAFFENGFQSEIDAPVFAHNGSLRWENIIMNMNVSLSGYLKSNEVLKEAIFSNGEGWKRD